MLPVVRILGNGAVSRSFALLLCSFAVSGCSLKSANDGAHLSLVLPNPHHASLAQSNLSGNQNLGGAPSAWNAPEFVCYGVNVTGPGIADTSANPDPNPDFAALLAGTTSCAYRGVVSNGFTFAAGQSEVAIDLQVPPGANRVIQLIGITNAAYCASHFLETGGATNPGAYEIGHVHTDLFGDATVSIPIAYTASESKRVDCGNGSAATVLTSPALTLTSSTFSFTVGTPISAVTPTNTGGAVTTCSITPTLPSGLIFDPNSCAISGTPAVISTSTNYTVLASNAAGSSGNLTFSIAVNAAVPVIAYSGSPFTFTKGSAIATQTPMNTGGAITNCSGTLPTGLSLSPSNCVITGTPTVISAATPYTITASNSGGTAAGVTITITVNDVPPSGLVYSVNPANYRVSTMITPNMAALTGGGPVTSYSVLPALPTGLSLNLVTGTITGTPTAVVGLAPYTVTATNSGGSTTVILQIAVVTPSLAWSPLTFAFGSVNVGSNSATQTFTLTNSGGGTATGCSAPSITDTTNFTITADTCGTSNLVGSGATCTVIVQGNPTTAGAKATTLSRTCTVGGTTTTTLNQIVVTGVAPLLAWSPLTNAFGNVYIGSNSGPQIFTLTNSGTATATACSAPSITDMTDFTVIADTCGTSTLAGSSATCSVTLRANPTTTGTKTTTLSRTCTFGGTSTTTANGISVTGLALPTVAITSPAAGSFVNASNKSAFTISGSCSESGQNVVLSGAGSATVVCSGGNTWTTNLDLSAAGDGSVTVYVDHSSSTGGVAVQSSRSFVKDVALPIVAITSPAAGTVITEASKASFTVTGTCSENGQVVVISGAATASPTCTAGGFTVSLNFTSSIDGAVVIFADQSDAAGNSATQATRNFNKDTCDSMLAGGNGSSGAPFPILSPTHLTTCIGLNDGATKFFKVMANISLTSMTAPIPSLLGTFDGNRGGGMQLTGLNLTSSTTSNIGLFAMVSGGTVTNVALNGVTINCSGTAQNCGSIAGSATGAAKFVGNKVFSGTTVTVNGIANVGGLVGAVTTGDVQFLNNSVDNLSMTAAAGSSGIGGLVGAFTKDTNNASANFYQNHVVGPGISVCGTDQGGLIGRVLINNTSNTFITSENAVKLPMNCGATSALTHLGGLIGVLSYGTSSLVTATIGDSDVAGDIVSTGSPTMVGGILGEMMVGLGGSNTLTITNASYRGNAATSAAIGAAVGGSDFATPGAALTTQHIRWYAQTYLTAANVGSYYQTPTTTNVVGYSLSQLQTPANLTGGNFANTAIWTQPGGTVYPYLTFDLAPL